MKLFSRRAYGDTPLCQPVQEALLDPNDPATILEWQFDARLAARGEEFEQGVTRALQERVKGICEPSEATIVADAIRFYTGSNTNIFRKLREELNGEAELSTARRVIDDFLPRLPLMQRLDMERELFEGLPAGPPTEAPISTLDSLGLSLNDGQQSALPAESGLAQVVSITRANRPA